MTVKIPLLIKFSDAIVKIFVMNHQKILSKNILRRLIILIIIVYFLIFSVIWLSSTERNFLKFWNQIFEIFSKFHVQAETSSTQFKFNSPSSIRLISIFE